MRGDSDQVFINMGRIRSHARFHHRHESNQYVMEIMDMEVSIDIIPGALAYVGSEEYYKNILIDNFINHPEYLKRFLILERRLKNLSELGI